MIHPEATEDLRISSTRRTLREFAGLCLLVFGGLCLASAARRGGWPSPAGTLAGLVALGVGIPGLVRPEVIRPVFLGAIAVSRPVGHLVGLVLLAIVYYGVITPIGLVFRVLGRDPLGRRRRDRPTYWTPRAPAAEPRLYLRQFQQQVLPTEPDRAGATDSVPPGSRDRAPQPIPRIPTRAPDDAD